MIIKLNLSTYKSYVKVDKMIIAQTKFKINIIITSDFLFLRGQYN